MGRSAFQLLDAVDTQTTRRADPASNLLPIGTDARVFQTVPPAGLHACSGQVVAAAYHDALPQPGGTSSHTPSLEAECSASHASHARVGEGHVLRAHRVRNVQASIIRHYLRGDTCNHVSQSSPSGLTTSNAIAFYRDGLGFKTDGR